MPKPTFADRVAKEFPITLTTTPARRVTAMFKDRGTDHPKSRYALTMKAPNGKVVHVVHEGLSGIPQLRTNLVATRDAIDRLLSGTDVKIECTVAGSVFVAVADVG